MPQTNDLQKATIEPKNNIDVFFKYGCEVANAMVKSETWWQPCSLSDEQTNIKLHKIACKNLCEPRLRATDRLRQRLQSQLAEFERTVHKHYTKMQFNCIFVCLVQTFSTKMQQLASIDTQSGNKQKGPSTNGKKNGNDKTKSET